jgi:hypothetical protein
MMKYRNSLFQWLSGPSWSALSSADILQGIELNPQGLTS